MSIPHLGRLQTMPVLPRSDMMELRQAAGRVYRLCDCGRHSSHAAARQRKNVATIAPHQDAFIQRFALATLRSFEGRKLCL